MGSTFFLNQFHPVPKASDSYLEFSEGKNEFLEPAIF